MSRTLRRPTVPPVAAGLRRALVAARAGDGAPLARWFSSGYPALVSAIRRAGWDPAAADEAAAAVVVRMAGQVRRGRPVRSEIPWMARVAGNPGVDAFRPIFDTLECSLTEAPS